jgi:hypothetical protein
MGAVELLEGRHVVGGGREELSVGRTPGDAHARYSLPHATLLQGRPAHQGVAGRPPRAARQLPNLRLDPEAPPPQPVGLYERGVMEIPVVFG